MKTTKSMNEILNGMAFPGMRARIRLAGGAIGYGPVEPPIPHYPGPPAPPKPNGGYRYQTGLEIIQKIVDKSKKPAMPKTVEGLVPIASRPIAAGPMNDILNQPDVDDIDEPMYCEDWYLGCPLCFRFKEGDPEVVQAQQIRVIQSIIACTSKGGASR